MKKFNNLNKNKLMTASVLAFCLIYQSAAFCEYYDPNVQIKTIRSSVKDMVIAKDKPMDRQLIDDYKGMLKSNYIDHNSANSKIINLKTEFNTFSDDIKIDFAFRDLDVATALRLLGKEGGKNVVVDDSVKGTINIDLKNVSLNEAMELVLTAQELEARNMGNTVFIASRPAMSKKGLNRKFIKAFKLNNANAVDVATILEASVFNKGYDVDEKASGDQSASSSLPAASGSTQSQAMPQSPPHIPAALGSNLGNQSSLNTSSSSSAQPSISAESLSSSVGGTSTGQSSLAKSRSVRAKVENIDPGSGFNDANQLASGIKLQGLKTAIEKVDVSNNNGGAIVIPDTRTNSVLIAGLKEDIDLAADTIKYLDKPLQQVSVEVSLLEIKDNDLKDFNIAGGAQGKRDFGLGSNNPYAETVKDQSAFTQGITKNTTLLTKQDYFSFLYDNSLKSVKDTFAFKLNYLNQKDKIKLLANPTIVTLDGSESLIKITDQIVSRLTVSVDQNGTIFTTPQLADVGIVLNLLPKVSSDGNVTMRIRPSVTSAGPKITTDKYGGFTSTVTPCCSSV